jgi:hypothetical protein
MIQLPRPEATKGPRAWSRNFPTRPPFNHVIDQGHNRSCCIMKYDLRRFVVPPRPRLTETWFRFTCNGIKPRSSTTVQDQSNCEGGDGAAFADTSVSMLPLLRLPPSVSFEPSTSRS